MTALTWDNVGQRLYETGVDHGVLYVQDSDGTYPLGVAWNGLETVTEAPTGATATATYADNIKYLNLISAETFEGTIDAYTYPDEFALCDGSAVPEVGVTVGQQPRKTFGLCYRTRIGNDIDGTEHGYKLHLVYGATAAPSSKAYASINDTPAAISFSWGISALPIPVAGHKPTATMTIDSTKVDPTALATLEAMLFGSGGGDAHLPTPDQVIAVFAGTTTPVDLGVSANQPTYNSSTHVVTLPTVTGVQWKINGANKSPGAQPALTTGQVAEVEATPTSGHYLTGDTDWTFDY
jgi:hypothetical protein